MSATKRPSTSSLRRYITSRPYVAIAEIRRRFGLDPEAVQLIARNGSRAYVGLPEREAAKIEDLWQRDEIGLELSVEVNAPVVVGVYPMRIARYVIDPYGNGHALHHDNPGANGNSPAGAAGPAAGEAPNTSVSADGSGSAQTTPPVDG